METSAQPIQDWHGWLALFQDIYSTQGLAQFIDIVGDDGASVGMSLMASYMIPVQTTLCTTMVMACLQSPQDQCEQTLASIVKMVEGVRFDKSPRRLKGKIKKKYQETAHEMSRIVPVTCELLASILNCYVNDDYDTASDANLAIREASTLLQSRKRGEAYQIMSRVGAAALRGVRIWDGWMSEGTGEFELWLLGIVSLRNALVDVIPLLAYAEQKQHADEIAVKQSTAIALLMEGQEDDSSDMAELNDDENDENPAYLAKLDEMMQICTRSEPFTDEEIKELGERYDMYGGIASQTIGLLQHTVDANDENGYLLRIFVMMLGVLRYPDQNAISHLTLIATGASEQVDDETIDAALTSLKWIGPPALPHVFDFVRYTSLEDVRRDMLNVLGVVGRGAEEVFEYLLKQFNEASWIDFKIDYVLPLALTHDPRAIGHIVAALRDPALDDDDAWELLDALQELEVTFYINPDNRSVNIPDYGVIEDVLPVGWRSRKELEEDDEWDEEWEAPNDLDSSGEDADENEDEEDDDLENGDLVDDEVVYDEDGIPRCPDCGAEMHYIDGVWVHEQDVEKPRSTQPKIKPVGRNDPCPCGSGKKYKNCHGRGV